ncbi:MAG TPA: alpha/beta hydrolase [Vicinamibacterales bacterium]|nr:alpha/beta hydrolase [Vicinamibacterales bacterium]
MAVEIRHEWVQGDGVRLRVARAGEGPPVVLLHGFPEDSRTWKHQIPALVAAGYSAAAPDQRGYLESDRPIEAGAYLMTRLVADVAAVVRSTGHGTAHVVGHDWGGVVAWTFAATHPELLQKLVILNAPHPELYRRKLRQFSRQALLAWYVLLFRIPRLSEWVISARDFKLVRDLLGKRPAKPAFTREEIDGYVEALSRPGALTAALRWYRDNASAEGQRASRSLTTQAPTLVIWGMRDSALVPELLDGLDQVAPNVRIHRMAAASHWVQNEAPDEVNRVMIDFLGAQ